MKTLKSMLLIAVITLGSLFSANATESATAIESKAITSEIGELLKKPSFTVENEVQAYVRLVLNENNEMVVLFVNSENELINNYIKSRLNYKKVSKNFTNKDQEYIVPVRITPSK
ncbi:hypothetical protein RXV94_07965 [Yeosuana sp. MJ-SS3]|uniref:Uncharacterized protein n=1 Tax=Gilvirhabdus luticola TaxID=3079858 RepID=A0ABU3U6Y4_9FLAO|nr:hypothetical protein [Yeosuana sp. MJ-SS3]MDU8886092.1 hypothetical protein [Yeosuana sp. MJ-SS3]